MIDDEVAHADRAAAAFAPTPDGPGPGPAGVSPWVPAPSRRVRPVAVVLGATWLGVVGGAALQASWLPLDDFAEPGREAFRSPGLRVDEPFGTDQLGRSELSRVVFGARVSLLVALGAVAIGLVVGTTMGVLAGYFRSVTEVAFDLVTTSMLAFPPLILLIALASVLTPGLDTLVLALGLLSIPLFGRVARANTLKLARREFVQASRAMGASHLRAIVREVLPNVLLPVMSYALVVLAALMVAEGSLSFLGLGIPPPDPSWGGMINAGRDELDQHSHLVLVPGICFVLTILSLNVIGDWLRSRLAQGDAA